MITAHVVESNMSAEEADIQISDGEHQFLCFAHPWSPSCDVTGSPYFLLGCRFIERCQNGQKIRSLGGYRHEICGTVSFQGGKEVKAGAFVFECDIPMPKDIRAGENVRLECERIST
jgi:hypothetical protein